MNPAINTIRSLAIASLICGLAAGCSSKIESFEGNRILAKRLELSESVPMDQPLADAAAVVAELFGTPDKPRWPEFIDQQGTLVSVVRLRRAAGPVSSDEQGNHYGLYREHCIACHGTSGNGLGPTAALLNPYPRNFRLGKFKFKSTPIGQKPTREDLRRILEHGVVGSSMPSFALLEDEDIEALVDYVIYLSLRGEVERRLLNEAALDLDFDEGERLYDPAWKISDFERYEDSWSGFEAQTRRIAKQWELAESKVLEIEAPPADLPVGRLRDIAANDSAASGTSEQQGHGSVELMESLLASIDRGKELFQGNVASCAFCHGMQGRGDGQQNNYDDWTRDWTQGFDPRNLDQLRPLLEVGALKPRHIQPRNLQLGVFRGGGEPADLYTRIVNGIEGTPMPAAPMKPANPQGLTSADVWDIVNFLLNLPDITQSSLNSTPKKSEVAWIGKELTEIADQSFSIATMAVDKVAGQMNNVRVGKQ